MFDALSDRLAGIFEGLTRRGALSEADVTEALREVRRALLEADVELGVARAFVDKVRGRAIGSQVLKSVTPGQMVVKIVHDTLKETLGEGSGAQTPSGLDLAAAPPVAVLMVGLQGSGKTTTTAKIALRLKEREKKRVLMASLDVRRPAAQEQLRVLGEQVGVDTLPIVAGQQPEAIATRAMSAARLGGYDVVMLDTAGRLSIDEALMGEVAEVKRLARPFQTLLVADALTGQDAVVTARAFEARVGLTGIVLTRIDGDGRGGAALSMRTVTGKPIVLLGTGEKVGDLETFDAGRIANRILGQGDIVALVERAAASMDAAKAQEMAERMRKGVFDLDDMAAQLDQVAKIGGMGGVLGMLPGMGKARKQIEAMGGLDERVIGRQRAIISSMTRAERRAPKVMNANRKKRVASGSGTSVQDVNKLLKTHRQMADVMKAMGQGKGGRGGIANMLGGMMGGGMGGGGMGGMPGGMPAMPPGGLPGPGGTAPEITPEMVEQLRQGGGMPKLPGLGGLGGLGGFKGLGGLPGMPGKKR